MKTEITFHDLVSSFEYLKNSELQNHYDFEPLEKEIKKLEVGLKWIGRKKQ